MLGPMLEGFLFATTSIFQVAWPIVPVVIIWCLVRAR